MKRWLLLPLLLVGSVTAVFAAQSQSELQSIDVGYVRVMDDAQVLVAKEGGYFKAHGLDVNLVEFSSGTDVIKAIVGGQLDYGVLGFSNAFTWASRGAALRIIGGAQRGYHSLVVRKDSGIDSVAELKGHTLASQKPGSTADIVLKGVVLANAGVSPEQVHIMGVSPAIAVQSLVAGHVDAAFLFEPYDRLARLKAPVKQIYEIGDHWPFPCMVVITKAETLKNNKDMLWAALDAQREAIQLLQDKPRQAARLIADYFVATPTIKTLHKGEMSRVKVVAGAIKTQTFSALLTPQDVERMHELKAIMAKQGILEPGTLNVDKVVDLSWQKARGLGAS